VVAKDGKKKSVSIFTYLFEDVKMMGSKCWFTSVKSNEDPQSV